MNKIKISLAGNPNVGKTSLFNAMTSSAERVGNWHGVTVVQKQKIVDFEGVQTTVVDLPGFYSMSAYSYEEEISRNEILFGKNDVIICVCEARNLARNLYLTLQLMETGARVVVAINMIDELQKKGYGFDVKRLSKVLGVPVIAVSSKNPEDVKKLLALAIKSAGEKQKSLDYFCDLPINEILTLISPYISNVKVDARFLAVKLIEDDEYVRGIVDLPQNVRDRLSKYGDFSCKIATARYDFINMAIDGVILKNRLKMEKLNTQMQ